MSKKFFKTISLVFAAFLLTANLGACKKKETVNTPSTTVTKSVTSSNNTRKLSTSTKSKNSTTNNGTTSANKNLNTDTDEKANDITSQYFGITSSEDIKKLLNINPMDEVPITNIPDNIDLNGATVKIVYDTNINKSPGSPPTNLELAQNPNLIARYNIIEKAKKKLNFEINWVYRSHDNMIYEYMDAIAAGTKYADILLSSTKRVFPTLAIKKLIVPIDNFIDFNNNPVYNFGAIATGTEFLGRRWGLVYNPYSVGYVFFYNRDIFAKEGFTDVQELYEQGLWTWDTMVEYAKSVTHDFNGDGKIDQWGILLSNLHMATQALIASNGGDMVRYDSNANTYKFAANEIKAARALQLVNDLVSSKVTTPDSSVKFDKFPSAMVLGKIVSDGLAYKQIGMNYGIAPLPKGPDVSETQFVNGEGVNAYFIPLNTDPKIAAAIIKEAFTYWDTNASEYLTKEDIMYSNLQPYLSTEEDVQWTMQNFASPRVTVTPAFETLYSNFNSNVVLKVAWNESTPAAALQAQADALQSDIDSALRP